jgi:hypothetical protein
MVATSASAGSGPHLFRRRNIGAVGTVVPVGHLGLGTVGFLLVIVSAWGGIIPFVGPTFGYSADGSGSWHWTLTHAVLALVPGAIAFVVGLSVLASSQGLVVGRGRLSLATAGLIVLACGGWFALGPWAWPVVDNTSAFFVFASPLHLLANVAGYAIGPGVIVAACGAFFMGWAARHQEVAPLTAPPQA